MIQKKKKRNVNEIKKKIVSVELMSVKMSEK